MKRFLFKAIVAGALLCTATAAASDYPNDKQSFDEIARGRYLTILGDCAACHNSPDGTPFAGGNPVPTPFGTMLGANITPDKATGIGTWSDEKFYHALHNGQGDGRLYPAMPYIYYTNMTRDDVMAIRAYLNTVKPVKHDVTSNILPFPFDLRAPAMTVWDWLFFNSGTWKPNPKKSAQWNRGAYIVEGPGHCGACHTPKTILGGEQTGRAYQGNALEGWFSPNITNEKRIGLADWTVKDIAEYLKTGTNRFTDASGPMADEIRYSSSQWTKSDLEAVAVFLKDQKGGNYQAPKPLAANDARMQAGKAIFADQCSACHAKDGSGIAHMFPQLKGSPFVQQPNPTSLLQVTVNGTRAVATQERPTGPAMPAFGWKLSNDQIAAVTTYVRNAWGNAASPVSAGQVGGMRHSGPGS